jgi:1-acyl-sn-glycerol-3-phosphate acyltransferase
MAAFWTPFPIVAGTTNREAEPPSRSLFARMSAGVLIAAARWLTGVHARWIGCAPAVKRRVYFANHSSHADFVAIQAALPPHLRSRSLAVAAGDYWTKGKVRRYVVEEVFRTILVDRQHTRYRNNPLPAMVRALDNGNSLILFPEGTRGDGERIQPFRCGIYHLARLRPEVELVPVWIDNLHRVLPKGALVPIPLECSVTFGPPTHLREGECKSEFLERLQQAVLSLRSSCTMHCS